MQYELTGKKVLTQRYEIGHKGAGDRATHELKRFRDAKDLTRTTVIAIAITITGNILHFDFRHARRFLSYKRRETLASPRRAGRSSLQQLIIVKDIICYFK